MSKRNGLKMKKLLSLIMAMIMTFSTVILQVTIVQAAPQTLTLKGLGNAYNETRGPGSMVVEGSGFVGMIGTGCWIRWDSQDLKGGVEEFELTYARGMAATDVGFDLRVAKPGSDFAAAQSIGSLSFSAATGSDWGSGGGKTLVCQGKDINSQPDGVYDVYAYFTGEYNFGGVSLTLKDTPTKTLSGLGEDRAGGSGTGGAMGLEGNGFVNYISGINSWIKYSNVDLLGHVTSFEVWYAANGNKNRTIEVLVAEPGKSIDEAVSLGAVNPNTSTGGWGPPNDGKLSFNTTSLHEGGVKDVYIRFIGGDLNFGALTLSLSNEQLYIAPTIKLTGHGDENYVAQGGSLGLEEDGFVNGISGDGSWIKFAAKDLLAGILKFEVVYAGEGDNIRTFDVLVGKLDGSIDDAVLIGSATANTNTGSWKGPGVSAVCDEVIRRIGGEKDVYIRFHGGNANFGSLTLTLKEGNWLDLSDYPETEEALTPDPPSKLTMWHNAPASSLVTSKTFAETGATPIGNGYMGAMIYGGVYDETILINEKTIWSGGPGANANYNGGHKGTPEAAHAALQRVREQLQTAVNGFTSGNYNIPSSVDTAISQNLFGDKSNFGSYQELGKIILKDDKDAPVGLKPQTNSPGSSAESVDNLFVSGNAKWYGNVNPTTANPIWITWGYTEPALFTQYTVRTANDEVARDPDSWTLFGSNDGKNYTAVHVVSSPADLPSGRNVATTFTITPAPTIAYKYYKLEIYKVKTSGRGCQLSEFNPIGTFNRDQTEVVKGFEDYRRELHMETGITQVTYTNDGVDYTKEYFMSYPDNVFAMKMSASEPFSQTFSLSSSHSVKTISVEDGNILQMVGRPSDQRADGLNFFEQVKVIPRGAGATVTSDGSSIRVEGADEIILIMAAGTNYQQCKDDTFNYFIDKDEAFNEVKARLNAAVAKGYNALRNSHKVDYQKLYSRVNFELTDVPVATKPTNVLIANYNKTGANANTALENRYLEMLYYQFNRYLLIASSREGSLPANLQGVWAWGLDPDWSSDYHTNINVQMNYWPAEQTNLAETHIPMLEYVQAQVPRGRITANWYHVKPDGSPVRGWAIYHENNIWGNTAPGTSGASYFPAGAAWVTQDIWEHYQFSQDKEFLAENYDLIVDAALFWVDNLWTDTRDGKLVANPSYSPEHGPYSLGSTSDQGMIWEIFEMAKLASEALSDYGSVDTRLSDIQEILHSQENLLGPQIGTNGQFQEWRDETTLDVQGTENTNPNSGAHRHANHLFMLHPGTRIVAGRSAEENAFADAMKVTLNTRGDGGTGWSKGWKINFWARLRDGDHSHKLLQELLSSSTLPNLLDTHAPYQIDGNFGAGSGMTEMLLQSHGGAIELLPALPSLWADGKISGLKARGNVEVDMAWSSKSLNSATLKPNVTGELTVKYPNLNLAVLKDESGKVVPFTAEGSDTIKFMAEQGKVYTFGQQDAGDDTHTVTFNITPAAADAVATITLQDSFGTICTAQADNRTYELEPGTYSYIIRAPLYITDMGTITVEGGITKNITLQTTPPSNLTLKGLGQDHSNGPNTGGAGGTKRDMEVEGSGYVGWIRTPAWIKYKDVNLLGGIESYKINFARDGSGNYGIDLRVAPSGSTSVDQAASVGSLAFSGSTGGWGSPGRDVYSTTILPHNGGVQDLYLVFTAGEINFGGLSLTLNPVEPIVKNYDISFSVRPYNAEISVEKLSGEPCSPTSEGGKIFRLEEGFYRYSVSREGYETKTVLLPANVSKRVMVVLLPEGAGTYLRNEAEDAVISGGTKISDVPYSEGAAVGQFATTNSLGSINTTFSNISHVRFEVPRTSTGIVEVVVGYTSSVTDSNQDRIAVRSNDGTVKEVYLNPSGKSSVFVDMRAGTNTLYVSNVLDPRVSNNNNAWINLDYIDVNSATTPGSVEPSEGDEPYIPPKNPIIKSIFTADPEAHVWPDNPNKLYLYPSHDIYPAQGCDLMDAYHVYSTENMVDWVDEGEILRADDLPWRRQEPSSFMWAPDAAYKDGYYYFYFPHPSGSNWGATWETGVRRSIYPDRDFEEIPQSEAGPDFKGYIEGLGGDGMIDVCVRVFDGQAYVYIGGSQRFYQGKLKDDMITLDGQLEQITGNNSADIGKPYYNKLPNYHEGPSVFERNGKYYLIYPGGSDSSIAPGDKFNYCMSDSPLGPWEFKGAFLNPTGCDTSHGSIVEFNDKWYMFYHTQDLSNSGVSRSVSVDEVTFDEDGSIILFSKTSNSVEQNGPDYIRPEGTIYGADEAIVDIAVKSSDSSAANGGGVITDLYLANSSVQFINVDGGSGSRANIIFHYSTPDALPKLKLSVNGFDYSNINFVSTGGRSFFAETSFTVKRLEPGKNNIIKLVGGNGKITLNYIEVILFDDSDLPIEIDLTVLNAKLEEAKVLVSDEAYKAESRNALSEVITAIEAEMGGYTKQSEVSAAILRLVAAVLGLEPVSGEDKDLEDMTLAELIERSYAELAKTDVYTEGSLENLRDAVESAEITLQSGKELAIAEARLDLITAIKALLELTEPIDIVAFNALKELIVKARLLAETVGTHTQSSRDKLADFLDQIEQYLEPENIDNDIIAFITESIQNLIDDLEVEFVEIDKTKLLEAIDTAEELSEENFTAKSWADMQEVLSYAKDIYLNISDDQELVDATVEALLRVIDALVNLEVLKTAITRENGLAANKYTLTSWYTALILSYNAKEVLAKTDATQEEVNAAADALNIAYDNLVVKVMKDNLKTAIDKASGLNTSSFTTLSVLKMKLALSNAQKVYNGAGYTQAEVDQAELTLNSAVEALEIQVIKTQLKELITKASAIGSSDYTFVSWYYLRLAISEATLVSNDANATQAQVDDQVALLNSAIDALIRK